MIETLPNFVSPKMSNETIFGGNNLKKQFFLLYTTFVIENISYENEYLGPDEIIEDSTVV